MSETTTLSLGVDSAGVDASGPVVTDPTDPTEPTDPTDSTEPIEAIESIEPTVGDGAGGREVLAAVVERRRAADRAEADLLALVVALMDAHPVVGGVEPARDWVLGDGVLPMAPPCVPVAGVGTPEVAEHAVVELGAALGISYRAALGLVGDVIELCLRLPRLWGLVQAGTLQAWKGRQVARATRVLSPATAGFLDRQLAVTARRNVVPSNLDAVVHEALLRCEPEVAHGREEAALAARGVGFDFGRSTLTCATATMTATLDTLDAIDLDNTITDMATVMGRLGDDSELGIRRAHALGMLADPQHTLDVFGPLEGETLPDISGTDHAGVATSADGDAENGTENEDGGDDEAGPGGGTAVGGEAPRTDATEADSRAAGFARPAGPAEGQRGPGGVLPTRVNATRATVYLHIDIDDLAAADSSRIATGTGGRVEKLGPATLDLLRHWLGRTTVVTVRPVLDVDRHHRIDGHDPTEAIRETVILRDGHCVFPGCRIDARGCDLDHITPYLPLDHGGPPGQTSAAALACLCRRHHRLKTHTGWHYQRLPDGDYAWTSPTGDAYTGHPDPKR